MEIEKQKDDIIYNPSRIDVQLLVRSSKLSDTTTRELMITHNIDEMEMTLARNFKLRSCKPNTIVVLNEYFRGLNT